MNFENKLFKKTYLGKSAVIKLDQLSTFAGNEWTVFKTDRRPSVGFNVISLLNDDMQVIFAMWSLDDPLPKKRAL